MKGLLRMMMVVCLCGVALTDAASAQAAKGKKGACLITGKANAGVWKDKVAALKPFWHYSWGGELPGKEPVGVEFVPMIWGCGAVDEKFSAYLKRVERGAKEAKSRCLLGFNEPDGEKQANMPVERALQAWPKLMDTGLRLGSPATVHPDNEWMKSFMKQAAEKKYRVDFVCMHWYGGPNAAGLIKKLEQVHQLYGKPIWITEFAVADWNAKTRAANKHSPETVLRFMKEVLPQLDKLDYVERYAWFSASEDSAPLGPSALFRADGTLTELGKAYAAYGR
ncbi:MAG TPA: glycoside hydrolase family protein [Luteolibacter sp.]|nr:glycoside hydrolase family protein [Luteolibacter sp.]